MAAGRTGEPGAAVVWHVVVEHKHARAHAPVHLHLVAVLIV